MANKCGCGGEKKDLLRVDWSVSGIKCEGCADTFKAAAEAITGVQVERVDVGAKRVLLRFNPARISEKQLESALAKAGFPVTV